MQIKFISCLLLLLFFHQSHAQTTTIDSLKKLFAATSTDTGKISLLNQLAEEEEDTASLNHARVALKLLSALPAPFKTANKKFFLHQKASAFYWVSNYFSRYTNDTDSAFQYLNRTLGVALENHDSGYIGLVYNDFAVLNAYDVIDSSIYWMTKSLPYTIASKDSAQLATAYSNFGYIYRVKGEYQKALDNLFKGMKIDDRLGNKEDVGIELNNIGQIYFDMKFYGEALDFTRRALAIAREAKDDRALSIRYNNLGGIYNDRGLNDSALIYYDSSLVLKLKWGSVAELGEVYSNIGFTWMNLNDYHKAISYYYESISKAKIATDTFQLYSTYINLADAFLREGVKTDSAGILLKIAYDYFKLNGNTKNIQEVTHLLMDVYGQKKDYAKAFAYSLEYIAARDTVESKEARKNALRKKFEFEYQNKEAIVAAEQQKKDDLAEEKLTAQKNIRNLFIAGSVFLLIIVALLFNRYRLKQRTTKALEAKNKIIEQEKRRAEESEKFKSRFLANMSHEIRTPMNAVMGLTNLLLDSETTEKQRFYLDAIKKSSSNLMVILNDVLDLSKLEAGKMQLEKIPFSIPEIVENVIITLRHKADEKGLKIQTKIKKEVPEFVAGDPSRLYQVLINLVGNAIKFTEKGLVEIRIENQESKVKTISEPFSISQIVFSITDTGIGIAKEKLQSIFESFKQAENDTSRKFGGSGLGLSISQQIVQLHGSEISVASTENKGSVFSFVLPYEISSAAAFEKYYQPVTEMDYSRFASLKILLAEDNEYNQLVTVESLKRLVPSLRIDVTENGKEALEALAEEEYDLILMDVQMPEMNGYEATKKIREEFTGKKKGVPVIALTASATREEIESGFAAGISAHLPKPFVASELLLVMARVLGWTSNNENSKAFFASVLPSDGESIDLSELEKYTEGDKELMRLFVEKFIKSIPQTFSQIKDVFERNEFDEVKRMIHTIKPQLVLLGVPRLHYLAEEIEGCILGGSSREKVSLLLSQFESALGNTITLLANRSID